MRIKAVRHDNSGDVMNQTQICELMVNKEYSNKVFFRKSHLETGPYRSITLKLRSEFDGASIVELVEPLYKDPQKIDKKKYDDLMKLCYSRLPVIRDKEFQDFYKNLKH